MYICNFRTLLILGVYFVTSCSSSEPMSVPLGALPFMVYFESYYRGMCMGMLINRFIVITAAVCVTNPLKHLSDQRPITVYLGTQYRHIARGLRVPVKQILLPKIMTETVASQGYLMQISVALLVLKHNVPDALVEVPTRAVEIDYLGKTPVLLQDECITVGYHYHYKDDPVYDGNKFLLQRNMRAQFINVVKSEVYCDLLELRFQAALENLGFRGYYDKESEICVRDMTRNAQACHGMYGAPLICHGKVVGMLMAPDGQWTNCTGMSNMYHRLNARNLKAFFRCLEPYFQPEWIVDMKKFIGDVSEKTLQNGEPVGDYISEVYDDMAYHAGGSSEEEGLTL